MPPIAYQPEEYQQNYGPPLPPPMAGPHLSDTSLVYLTNAEEVVDEVIHIIKCEIRYSTKEGKVVWQTPSNVKPLANDECLRMISGDLRMRLAPLFQTTHFEEDMIERLTVDFGEKLYDDFELNWIKYDIKDLPTAERIIALVVDAVYAASRKALKGAMLKTIMQTHSVHELQSHSSQQVKNSGSGLRGAVKKLLLGDE